MNRRGFLTGMAGILAAGYSASVLPSGVIMPIRKVWTPDDVWALGPTMYYENGRIHVWNPATMVTSTVNPIHTWDVRAFEGSA